MYRQMCHSSFCSVWPFDFLLCKVATVRYERDAMPRQPTKNRYVSKFVARALATVVLGSVSLALAEDGFFLAIDDLPLMPGLTEVPGAGVVFDKPQGRIVEAYAEGAVAGDVVAAFYENTLPQLGWTEISSSASNTHWRREGEVLQVEVLVDHRLVTVRFYLTPN